VTSPAQASAGDAVGDAGPEIAALVAAGLRDIADFPLPGIVFKDIVPLIANGSSFAAVIHALATLAVASGAGGGIDLIAGIEARGFILAAPVAHELGCGLVPIRKAGKLPPPTLRQSYVLEYGTADLEVPQNVLAGKRVFLVDDVLATGGTLEAAADLIGQAGATVAGIGVLLELGFLAGRARAHLTNARALLRI
jgi:adenine phosphoribosyltransferase